MKQVPLSEAVELNPRPARDLLLRDSEEVSFLPMAAVSETGRVTEQSRPISEVKKGFTYFERGDVLLAKITPCMENGKAAHLRELKHAFGFGSTEFHVLRPKPGVDGRYIFYAVWNESFRDLAGRNMTGTGGQQRVPTAFLERHEVPLPPLPEQRRIADILDKADAIRRKRKEAIALTEELLRSAFLEMFGEGLDRLENGSLPGGWSRATVDEVKATAPYSCIGGPFGSNLTSADYVAEGVPVIRGTNLGAKTNTFIDDGFVFVSETKANDLHQNMAYPGDLVFTQRGTLGQVALIPGDSRFPRYVVSQSQMKLRPDTTRVSPLFLHQLFCSEKLQRYIRDHALVTGVPHINLGILRATPIIIPPKATQDRFGDFATELGALRARLTSAERDADSNFDSLVHRAFRGEL